VAKLTVIQAAVHVLESEGVGLAFGIPGAAILPLYEALKASRIRHVLVRHGEGGTHAAEGYTRAATAITSPTPRRAPGGRGRLDGSEDQSKSPGGSPDADCSARSRSTAATHLSRK
jgi:tartronate-semialdehyde synthase